MGGHDAAAGGCHLGAPESQAGSGSPVQPHILACGGARMPGREIDGMRMLLPTSRQARSMNLAEAAARLIEEVFDAFAVPQDVRHGTEGEPIAVTLPVGVVQNLEEAFRFRGLRIQVQ